MLFETGAPIRVLAGYLGHVTVSVPWSALLTDSCRVDIAELSLTVSPCFQQRGDENSECVCVCVHACVRACVCVSCMLFPCRCHVRLSVLQYDLKVCIARVDTL